MRIKTEFIANSSTSVYVYYIPQEFYISEEDVKTTDYYKELDEDEKFNIMHYMDEHIAAIRKTGTTDEWLNHWKDFAIFRQLLEKKAHQIKCLDVGGGEGTYLVCINAKDIADIEEKYNADEEPEEEKEFTIDPASIEPG